MLKGAKLGKATIHKGNKRQLIHLVLMTANRLQFKFGRSQLKGSNSIYRDNSYLP